MKISAVIPVFNEEKSLKDLHDELLQSLTSLRVNFEIIYVDDGSTDDSHKILKGLTKAKIVTFRKRFGQTAAIDAGLKEANGDVIVTLDADGQDDPKEITTLLQFLFENDLDCVSGWRKNRQDSKFKIFSSKIASILRNIIAKDGVHDSGCTLKVYKKESLENLDLYGEMHRFIPALLVSKGFKVGELVVNHRPRKYGKTKYNLSRSIKGFLDLVAVMFWRKFVNRPLHLFGTTGIILISVSFILGIFLIYSKIFSQVDLSDTALTNLSLFAFILGLQFIAFGLLADMVSKIYFSTDNHDSYSIKEIHENK